MDASKVQVLLDGKLYNLVEAPVEAVASAGEVVPEVTPEAPAAEVPSEEAPAA